MAGAIYEPLIQIPDGVPQRHMSQDRRRRSLGGQFVGLDCGPQASLVAPV